ncbi:50S ribosomal protein L3 glutamine methyltransferase [Thalassocella blandensis]|nr:50S ribosomal protein L3 glutamine methyltransferase [Thalassocella blandensis]
MTNFPDFAQSEASELETILDWIRWGSSQFTQAGLYFGHGTDNAWDEAAVLALWAIDQTWDMYEQIKLAKLTSSEKKLVYRLFMRRIHECVPAAYLTGVAWFAGLPYKITPDVLVPRSPVAELIQNAFEPWLSHEPRNILDLCTGSGCIGLACAHQFPEAAVLLSDISPAALNVARQNIEFHGLSDRVHAVESDGLTQIPHQTFDLIVSNPPYVDKEDLANMPREYHAEPEIGLASGDDGLNFTRELLKQAGQWLTEDGLLVVEVGNSWVALEQAFPNVAFTWPELENGGHGVFVLSKAQLADLG